jgi:hypothetical protein
MYFTNQYIKKTFKSNKPVIVRKFKIIILIPGLIFFYLNYAKALEIWVSPSGSDSNPGTKELPMETILTALRKARELRRLNDPAVKEGTHIILKGGIFKIVEPILVRPEDSGTEDSPVFIEAALGEHPVISSGINIINWKKVSGTVPGLPEEAQGNTWIADIPELAGRKLEFRQLWVNGQKAMRAGNFGEGELARIFSVDAENEEILIPAPELTLQEAGQLEFVIMQRWAIAILRVKEINVAGDSAHVRFHQPESRIEFEHPWPAPYIDSAKNKNGSSAFYFANAIQLLNRPGEWYADMDAGKVYYWPRKGEDLNIAEVLVPCLETLVSLEGIPDLPVSNIVFKGISFEHTTWLRPSEKGHVPVQAGWSIIDAYRLMNPTLEGGSRFENHHWIERQSAGVTVKGAHHIRFERCGFTHMAATGLDFVSGTHHNLVEGCIFNDIGGTAIQIGFFGGAGFESHIPYNPSDKREVCQYEKVSNNLITDCTNEDWGCVGISVGYARNINIEHNEVSHINYSGICIGWGWTKDRNCMRSNIVHANLIHHFAKQLYDVGGIYTLSAQPETEISNNSIHHLEKAPYAHDPEHYQYIYLDEGSSFIRVADNWTEEARFKSNSPGPGNEWINNGPQVSEKIKNKAGLEPEFMYLLESAACEY